METLDEKYAIWLNATRNPNLNNNFLNDIAIRKIMIFNIINFLIGITPLIELLIKTSSTLLNMFKEIDLFNIK